MEARKLTSAIEFSIITPLLGQRKSEFQKIFPVFTKTPALIDWKIYHSGDKTYHQHIVQDVFKTFWLKYFMENSLERCQKTPNLQTLLPWYRATSFKEIVLENQVYTIQGHRLSEIYQFGHARKKLPQECCQIFPENYTSEPMSTQARVFTKNFTNLIAVQVVARTHLLYFQFQWLHLGFS